MYYLSELYGKIGQILAEHGDMVVVRPVSRKTDIVCSQGPFYKDLRTEDFQCEDYSIQDNTGKVLGREKRFIVDTFN